MIRREFRVYLYAVTFKIVVALFDHTACFISPFSRSGFRATDPTGDQFRVSPDQRLVLKFINTLQNLTNLGLQNLALVGPTEWLGELLIEVVDKPIKFGSQIVL